MVTMIPPFAWTFYANIWINLNLDPASSITKQESLAAMMEVHQSFEAGGG